MLPLVWPRTSGTASYDSYRFFVSAALYGVACTGVAVALQALMYLLDTNVWLERLLGQTNADDVRQLLETVPVADLFLTGFAFHSIRVILTRLKKEFALEDFVEDLFVNNAVTILTL